METVTEIRRQNLNFLIAVSYYTSDAADDLLCVYLRGARLIKNQQLYRLSLSKRFTI